MDAEIWPKRFIGIANGIPIKEVLGRGSRDIAIVGGMLTVFYLVFYGDSDESHFRSPFTHPTGNGINGIPFTV